ncbi:MAG: hypothetical protein EBU84_05605 [Actinobacteria bacterium]|nr:hypothetical protein [Actinomycetota bacterium]
MRPAGLLAFPHDFPLTFRLWEVFGRVIFLTLSAMRKDHFNQTGAPTHARGSARTRGTFLAVGTLALTWGRTRGTFIAVRTYARPRPRSIRSHERNELRM